MIRKTGGVGIAIENRCALVFIDGQVSRVIRARRTARAYRVYKLRGKVTAEQIP
jgi:hypothetical protein